MRKLLFPLVLLGCSTPASERKDVSGYYSYERRDFDAASWGGSDFLGRGSMIDDLLDSQVLYGLTEPEVITLLGEPTERGDLRAYYAVVTDTGGVFMPSMHYILVLDFDSVQSTVSNVWMTD